MEFDFIRTTFLAFIQGLTEFLPISSSAHLILPSALLGWEDQGLAFDVAVHIGTLSAVVVYFRHELARIVVSCVGQLAGKGSTADSNLGWQLLIATLPIIIVGFIGKDFVDQYLRSTTVIASATIVFALVLLWADKKSGGELTLADLTWKSALFIGVLQILALVPGTSRSGITMTAALFCKLDRESSSRFSFLLSIPVIAGAGTLLFIDLLSLKSVNWLVICYATLVAAVVAFSCIHFFLKVISRMGFMPFVAYRLLLGIILFAFFI